MKEIGFSDFNNKTFMNERDKLLTVQNNPHNIIQTNTIENTKTDYLGKKTRINFFESKSAIKNNFHYEKIDKNLKETNQIINNNYSFKNDVYNLELTENSSHKINFNYSETHNKFQNKMGKDKDNIMKIIDSKELDYLSPNTRKNSDLFSNKRFNDIFNLDSNFDNAEDLINFDCFSNGLFSNKEITFDENYNSHGEELDKINFSENKINEVKDSMSKDNILKDEAKIKNKAISDNINKQDNANNNNDEQTLNHEPKKIKEILSYDKKNMKNLKKFFNQNNKNENKTIKSIDDSTTVSTQFTKEKNSTKYSQSNEKNNSNLNSIDQTMNKMHNKLFNNESLYSDEYRTPNKIKNLNSLKNYVFEKEDIFMKNRNKSANDQTLLKSEENLKKFGSSKRVYIETPKNIIENNNFIKWRFNNKNHDSAFITNNFLNFNHTKISKEENSESFSIKNDFRKNLNDKVDSESDKIYKNLLATAKFFDLDG